MLKVIGGKYNCGISMENARKVLRVSFLFQTLVARLCTPSSLLADSILIDGLGDLGNRAHRPSSPTRKSEGSGGEGLSSSCLVANLSYNAVQVISDMPTAACSFHEMKRKEFPFNNICMMIA